MIKSKKKILALPGSTRNGSANEGILRTIAALSAGTADMHIYSGIRELPYFDPDQDKEEAPAVVATFRRAIEAADGIIICTPEYVFSLPGILKNALEWTVSTTLFQNKPVALIVAAASGEKALESLLLIMRTFSAKIIPETLLIRGASGKLDKNGKITDEKLLSEIKNLMAPLEEMMHTNKEA
ncbi:NADPH-dependent FMN reductase [Compostibacter hankyongensis]|uniref:NADPH-dependent FMN reductase-like domain-containing protein n=1 Tax=Compostibacter hankyongensis TaxID=1007089 RepID=A0ABP8FZ92_9BACT